MFMAITSSPFLTLCSAMVAQGYHDLRINSSLKDTTLTKSKHPSLADLNLKQVKAIQAAFTQGNSASNLSSANLLDQYHLTVPCSATLPSSRVLPS